MIIDFADTGTLIRRLNYSGEINALECIKVHIRRSNEVIGFRTIKCYLTCGSNSILFEGFCCLLVGDRTGGRILKIVIITVICAVRNGQIRRPVAISISVGADYITRRSGYSYAVSVSSEYEPAIGFITLKSRIIIGIECIDYKCFFTGFGCECIVSVYGNAALENYAVRYEIIRARLCARGTNVASFDLDGITVNRRVAVFIRPVSRVLEWELSRRTAFSTEVIWLCVRYYDKFFLRNRKYGCWTCLGIARNACNDYSVGISVVPDNSRILHWECACGLIGWCLDLDTNSICINVDPFVIYRIILLPLIGLDTRKWLSGYDKCCSLITVCYCKACLIFRKVDRRVRGSLDIDCLRGRIADLIGRSDRNIIIAVYKVAVWDAEACSIRGNRFSVAYCIGYGSDVKTWLARTVSDADRDWNVFSGCPFTVSKAIKCCGYYRSAEIKYVALGREVSYITCNILYLGVDDELILINLGDIERVTCCPVSVRLDLIEWLNLSRLEVTYSLYTGTDIVIVNSYFNILALIDTERDSCKELIPGGCIYGYFTCRSNGIFIEVSRCLFNSDGTCGVVLKEVDNTFRILTVINIEILCPCAVICVVTTYAVALRRLDMNAFCILIGIEPCFIGVLSAVKSCDYRIVLIIKRIEFLDNELIIRCSNCEFVVIVNSIVCSKSDIVRLCRGRDDVCAGVITLFTYELTVKGYRFTCQRFTACDKRIIRAFVNREFFHSAVRRSEIELRRSYVRSYGNNFLFNCKRSLSRCLSNAGNRLYNYSVRIAAFSNLRFNKSNRIRRGTCCNKITIRLPDTIYKFFPLVWLDAGCRLQCIYSKCCIFTICYCSAYRIGYYQAVITFALDFYSRGVLITCLIYSDNCDFIFTARNTFIVYGEVYRAWTFCQCHALVFGRCSARESSAVWVSNTLKRWSRVVNTYVNRSLWGRCPFTRGKTRFSCNYRSDSIINYCGILRGNVDSVARIILKKDIDNLISVRSINNEWRVIGYIVPNSYFVKFCFCLIRGINNIVDLSETAAICIIGSGYYTVLRIVEEEIEYINRINKLRPFVLTKFNRTGRISLVNVGCYAGRSIALTTAFTCALKCVNNTVAVSAECKYSLFIVTACDFSPVSTAVSWIPECCLTECVGSILNGYNNILICPLTGISLISCFGAYGQNRISIVNCVNNHFRSCDWYTGSVCNTYNIFAVWVYIVWRTVDCYRSIVISIRCRIVLAYLKFCYTWDIFRSTYCHKLCRRNGGRIVYWRSYFRRRCIKCKSVRWESISVARNILSKDIENCCLAVFARWRDCNGCAGILPVTGRKCKNILLCKRGFRDVIPNGTAAGTIISYGNCRGNIRGLVSTEINIFYNCSPCVVINLDLTRRSNRILVERVCCHFRCDGAWRGLLEEVADAAGVLAVRNSQILWPCSVYGAVSAYCIAVRRNDMYALLILDAVVPCLCFILWTVECRDFRSNININSKCCRRGINSKSVVAVYICRFCVVCKYNTVSSYVIGCGLWRITVAGFTYELTCKGYIITVYRCISACEGPVSLIRCRELCYPARLRTVIICFVKRFYGKSYRCNRKNSCFAYNYRTCGILDNNSVGIAIIFYYRRIGNRENIRSLIR